MGKSKKSRRGRGAARAASAAPVRPLIQCRPPIEEYPPPSLGLSGTPWETDPLSPWYALIHGHNDFVRYCLQGGWVPTYCPEGHHPLLVALKEKNYDGIDLLLSYGVTWEGPAWQRPPGGPLFPSWDPRYPVGSPLDPSPFETCVGEWKRLFEDALPPIAFILHKAVMVGEESLVEALVDDPRCWRGKDSSGKFPLDYAAEFNHPGRLFVRLVSSGVSDWTQPYHFDPTL